MKLNPAITWWDASEGLCGDEKKPWVLSDMPAYIRTPNTLMHWYDITSNSERMEQEGGGCHVTEILTLGGNVGFYYCLFLSNWMPSWFSILSNNSVYYQTRSGIILYYMLFLWFLTFFCVLRDLPLFHIQGLRLLTCLDEVGTWTWGDRQSRPTG